MKRLCSASFTVAVTGLVVAACQSYESGAKESFSKSHTCPLDRIQVMARPELKPSMLQPKSEPPPEIKADAARRKMWEDKEAETTAKSDGYCEMWEAKGCDKHELLCCYRPGKKADRVNCSARAGDKLPAGMTKL